MMTGREVVRRTLAFDCPDRLARDYPEPYGSDFAWCGIDPSPDARPRSGVDEWGAVWYNIGVSNLGEVKEFPLKDWADFDRLPIPDIHDPRRYTALEGARERAGDKFLLGGGISIYERVHFIRGLENTWADIHEAPDRLGHLLDLLTDMNLVLIDRYAAAGCDGYIFCDDWGLQTRLMIAPASWRTLWKPRYARICAAAHAAGLATFLHSCGHIVAILDDLIEIGLDVIQMDQQENMGLDLLGQRFAGRITFWNPVDIQKTMAHGTLDEIRAYARRMALTLGRWEQGQFVGGFLPKWYSDPAGAGHRQEAIDAMCQAFLEISMQSHAKAQSTQSA
jgi:hypothetical protein